MNENFLSSLKSAIKGTANSIKNFGTKELTSRESADMMKNLLKKSRVKLTDKQLKPGKIISFSYRAQDQLKSYDKTPLVMVLSQNRKYMLGINLHWAPMSKRLILVNFILNSNKTNIKNGKPLEMTYQGIRGAIKAIGAFPVIRLYIKRNMSKYGVVVPDEMLLPAAKMKTETFTRGKTNSTTLWSRAVLKAKTAKRKLSS